MDKCFYFLVPFGKKWECERRIVNELNASCYRVVNRKMKQFANDDMWINMDGRLITVWSTSEFEDKINNTFYRK